jgi:hypothetical protein
MPVAGKRSRHGILVDAQKKRRHEPAFVQRAM